MPGDYFVEYAFNNVMDRLIETTNNLVALRESRNVADVVTRDLERRAKDAHDRADISDKVATKLRTEKEEALPRLSMLWRHAHEAAEALDPVMHTNLI
jgi:2-phosphoglycerate kinase